MLHRPLSRSRRWTAAVVCPLGSKPPTTYATLPTSAAETSPRESGDSGCAVQRPTGTPASDRAGVECERGAAARTTGLPAEPLR